MSYNYEIAHAKVKIEGKGNTLFKLFGALTAYRGSEYSLSELETLCMEKRLSMEKVLKAYQWALEKQLKQPAADWQKSAFY